MERSCWKPQNSLWLKEIASINRHSSRTLQKFLMRMIFIYFCSVSQVTFALQTCFGYPDMLRCSQPVGMIMLKISNLTLIARISPQWTAIQAELFRDFAWGWLLSTFIVSARLHSLFQTCFRCPDMLGCSQPVGIIMLKISNLTLIARNCLNKPPFKQNSSEISHEDD